MLSGAHVGIGLRPYTPEERRCAPPSQPLLRRTRESPLLRIGRAEYWQPPYTYTRRSPEVTMKMTRQRFIFIFGEQSLEK